jgi:hypothetical protein
MRQGSLSVKGLYAVKAPGKPRLGAVPLAPVLRIFNYGPTPVGVGSCATSLLFGARMASHQKAAHLEESNQGENWFKDESARQQ